MKAGLKPKGWVRNLRSVEHLLRLKDGSRYWPVVLVVVAPGFRRFGGRMGREVAGLFRGVRRLRAFLFDVAVVGVWVEFLLFAKWLIAWG